MPMCRYVHVLVMESRPSLSLSMNDGRLAAVSSSFFKTINYIRFSWSFKSSLSNPWPEPIYHPPAIQLTFKGEKGIKCLALDNIFQTRIH